MVHMRHIRPARIVLAVAATLMALSACTSAGGAGGYSGGNQAAQNGRANVPAPSPGRAGDSAVDPRQEPQSTFGLDIDTASYTYARRQILDGRRPDASAVRPEEFINAFAQDYPEPGGAGITVTADGARMPASHQATAETRLMRIGLQTRGEDVANRPDAALTFVVDVSGSMAEPGRLDLSSRSRCICPSSPRPTHCSARPARQHRGCSASTRNLPEWTRPDAAS